MTDQLDPLDQLAIGYVLPTEEEITEIWKTAMIVLDANVLLNVYRYSPAAREQLLEILETYADRLFIPHQAASEYFRNRVVVLTEQLTAKEQMRSGINKAIEALLATLVDTHAKLGRRDGPDELTATARKKLEDLRDELLAAEDGRLPTGDHRADQLHLRLVSILRDKVGLPYEHARHEALCAEAAKRYEQQIPPGYMDVAKDDGGVGDFVFWSQILDHAEEGKLPIVLVSDDTKEDWVWEVKGRSVGPRPELARELHARAGVPLLIYTTSRFLTFGSKDSEKQIDPEIIEEAQAVEVASRWSGVPDGSRDAMEVPLATLARLRSSSDNPPAEPRLLSLALTDPSSSSLRIRLVVFTAPALSGVLTCIGTTPDGRPFGNGGCFEGSAAPWTFVFPDDFSGLHPAALTEGVYQIQWRFHQESAGAPTLSSTDTVFVPSPQRL